MSGKNTSNRTAVVRIAGLVLIASLLGCTPKPPSTISTSAASSSTSPTQAPTATRAPEQETTVPGQAATTMAGLTVEAMPAKPPSGIAGGDSIGDERLPALGNTGYDAQDYFLDLRIDDSMEILTATVTITSAVTLDGMGRLSLDFRGYTIDSIKVDDAEVEFYRAPEKIYLDLPRAYGVGETLTAQIHYYGEMMSYTSNLFHLKLGIESDPQRRHLVAFSEPEGAHFWFPSNDHPTDTARFKLKATVPTGLMAISNGTLLQEHKGEQQATYVWGDEAPMAPYLLAFAVGDYQRVDSPPIGEVEIRHYIFKGDQQAQEVLKQTAGILQFLIDLIGPYPYHEFGFLEVDKVEFAGMETQTMIMIDRDIIDLPFIRSILVHELAHQWFGNSIVLKSWGDIWLKEGLATYIEVLWARRTGDGKNEMTNFEKDVLSLPLHEKGSSLAAPENLYTSPYTKGAWVFYMLEQKLGKETFRKVIQQYYQRFAGKAAGTRDFQAIAEDVSGENLEGFFDQWVYSEDTPYLKITYTVVPTSEGSQVEMQICQSPLKRVYEIPVDIRFTQNAQTMQQEEILVDERQESMKFIVPYEEFRTYVDPDQKILARVELKKVQALKACGQ